AVYALERSQVSGGTTNDTIPYQRTATASAYTVDYVAKTAAVTSAGHDIVAGSAVVTGISQAATISAISCLGLTVTVTATGHGVAIGDNVTIQGVSPTAYNGTYVVTNVSGNTFQYIVPAQIASSGSGATMKAYNAMLETSNVVSSVASGTFTVSLPKLWTDSVNAPVTGTMVVSQSIDYTVSNPNVRPIVTQSFEIDNGIADVLMYNHGYTQGRYITIKNCTNPAVNGSWRITNVISGSEFQFEVPALVNTATTTVTGDFEYVSHQYDYGFSSKQVLEVSFGSSFANQTASFLLYYFRDADGIQTFLDSPDNKVLCGDYLARGFNLHLLDVSVTSYNGPAASSTTIQSAVEGYLSSMSPGDTLVLSDLIQALGTAGISNIKTPVDVKYTRYTRDLTPAVSGTVVDYLDPQDKTNVFLLRSVSTSTENV
ncbi:MAG TPA: hypothetical protein VFM18_01955, partial [Methanosarcina sp.]|nr:hypothetical protein [Methanosarcina sp.]